MVCTNPNLECFAMKRKAVYRSLLVAGVMGIVGGAAAPAMADVQAGQSAGDVAINVKMGSVSSKDTISSDINIRGRSWDRRDTYVLPSGPNSMPRESKGTFSEKSAARFQRDVAGLLADTELRKENVYKSSEDCGTRATFSY